MAEAERDTGLIVVRDYRHQRADPRDLEPNDNPVPVPAVSVGPNASEGFGNTHVMYPTGSIVPQAWSGWPSEWATPRWGSSVGLGEILERISTVFFCLDLNASILSTMPIYRTRGTDTIDGLDWMENPQPEVYNDWTEAFKQVVFAYSTGEAFIWCTSRYDTGELAGRVRTWVMLNPSFVNVEMSGALRRYTLGGLDITEDVLHLRYVSWPGDARGHGPLEAAAANLYGGDALERYQANLAIRGGIPWGVLTAAGNIDAEQANEMRDRFVAARASAMGAPAVLGGGLKLEPMTINPRDMALLELQQFNASRLALLCGVPPFLAGLPSGGDPLTYNTAEGIYDFHWRAFLNTRAQAVMSALSWWALPRGQRVELNRDAYTRPRLPELAQAFSVLFNIYDERTGDRAITIPEIRAQMRLSGVSSALELTGMTSRPAPPARPQLSLVDDVAASTGAA